MHSLLHGRKFVLQNGLLAVSIINTFVQVYYEVTSELAKMRTKFQDDALSSAKQFSNWVSATKLCQLPLILMPHRTPP